VLARARCYNGLWWISRKIIYPSAKTLTCGKFYLRNIAMAHFLNFNLVTDSFGYLSGVLLSLFHSSQWSFGLMVKSSLKNCLKYGIDGRRNMGPSHYHSLIANPTRWSFTPGLNGFRGLVGTMTKHPTPPG
jgi:hypothetical protein